MAQELDQRLIDTIIENNNRVGLAVSRLLRDGANPNAINTNDPNRLCAMYYGLNTEKITVIHELINRGGGVNFRYMQSTPYNLYTLFVKKELEPEVRSINDFYLYSNIIRQIREQGVFIHVANSDGETPLDIICRRGHLNHDEYEDQNNMITVPMQYQILKDLAYMFERAGDSYEFEYRDHPLFILEDYIEIARESGNNLAAEAIEYFIEHRNFADIDRRFFEGELSESSPSTDWSINPDDIEEFSSPASLTSSERRRLAERQADMQRRAAAAAAAAAASESSNGVERCTICDERLNNIDGPGPSANCNDNCNDVLAVCEHGHQFHRGCILDWCGAGEIDVGSQMGAMFTHMSEMKKGCPLCNMPMNCADFPVQSRVEFEPSPISLASSHTLLSRSSRSKGKSKGSRRKNKNKQKTRRRIPFKEKTRKLKIKGNRPKSTRRIAIGAVKRRTLG